MITIRNLNKKYGNSVIFENACFTFPKKGLISILGPSGCGKSTLLNLIAGFDSDYEGKISVHGTTLPGMNPEELCTYRRNTIGFIFQNYHLLSGYTATENIMLATDVAGETSEAGLAKAHEFLKKFGLSDKADQKVETLSGGQKQRIAIARALVNDPSIILADEPTGALDRKNSDEIMELLKTLSKDRLVIVITHDKKCAEYADQVVTIQDGKLVTDTPDGTTLDNTTLDITALDNTTPKLSLWKRAKKNFRVHFSRSIAIALAIAIGVFMFTLSLSSGNIMEQSILDFEAKNTAFHNGYIKADGNADELLELLTKDERLENCYAQYVLSDITLTSPDGVTVALEEKYPMAKATEELSYGVMPRRWENEIAINPSLAAKFDKNIQNLIGKALELTYNDQTWSVTISGIFNATFDDYYVSSDIEQQMYEGLSGDAYSVSYDVKEFEEIPVVNNDLQAQNIISKNAATQVSAFLKTFKNLNRLFFTISVLIFVIGLFISTLLLVKQQNTRYREVGLLSALGYTKGHITKILLYENLGLAGLAVLCNAVLTALALPVSKLMKISLVFTLPQVLMSLILTAVMILLIGFVSSSKLIRTEPAIALRK